MAQFYTKNGENYEEVQGFTQTEVDEIVGKRLERERAKYADYTDLKSKVESLSSEKSEFENKLAEISAQKDDLAKQLEQAKLNAEKTNLLREFNISSELEEFVTGANAEEMRARAEKLSRSTAKAISIDKQQKPEPKHSEFGEVAHSLFGPKKD